ncbi:hypothetical protein AB6F62_16575 [Providencia huaxiensis]|uniref:hypothetical protein n=1 Tax=Providencia huaxiensis TaxID=2027290 RepID=UPI0034DDAEAE
MWGGYDPALWRQHIIDCYRCAPLMAPEYFRNIGNILLAGFGWRHQAKLIEDLTKKYRSTHSNDTYYRIDSFVYEMVQIFCATYLQPILYSLQMKTHLVMKMIDIVDEERIEWDMDQKKFPRHFYAFVRTTTNDRWRNDIRRR